MNKYLVHKSHEPSLIAAFKDSKFRPEVEPITTSDMMSTGGTIHESRFKLTCTTKTGNFMRVLLYIPGSSLEDQHSLSEEDRAALTLWLSQVRSVE